MNSNTFRMPARRPGVAASAAAVVGLAVAGPLALAVPAHATGGSEGQASAVVLRTGLDVSLLNKTVQVPLRTSLNEVHAPGNAEKTALTVQLEGVDEGRPFSVLSADAASARATANRERAEGVATLAHAKVHVPGLALLSLIEVEKVTAKAVCAVGEKPQATANVLGTVRALGKKVALTSGAPSKVEVPGVGAITLDLSRTETTSRTAAATALELKVSVNPLKLNVAEVEGTVTLAAASCESPEAAAPAPGVRTQTGAEPAAPQVSASPAAASPGPGSEGLAATGGGSTTPYAAAAGVALLATGAAAVALSRRRARD
ncbi:SCO1860 family LAETG-anchored protein [Streptomyces sp. NPDC019396]|uniref:SCO1860 family LAETG-anchored protein n=1 Tax=Streptomyces sp. NPDC019396 TaxID=3154687 RepID=UPI0033E09C5A